MNSQGFDIESLAANFYRVHCDALNQKTDPSDPVLAWTDFRADPANCNQVAAWRAVAALAHNAALSAMAHSSASDSFASAAQKHLVANVISYNTKTGVWEMTLAMDKPARRRMFQNPSLAPLLRLGISMIQGMLTETQTKPKNP